MHNQQFCWFGTPPLWNCWFLIFNFLRAAEPFGACNCIILTQKWKINGIVDDLTRKGYVHNQTPWSYLLYRELGELSESCRFPWVCNCLIKWPTMILFCPFFISIPSIYMVCDASYFSLAHFLLTYIWYTLYAVLPKQNFFFLNLYLCFIYLYVCNVTINNSNLFSLYVIFYFHSVYMLALHLCLYVAWCSICTNQVLCFTWFDGYDVNVSPNCNLSSTFWGTVPRL